MTARGRAADHRVLLATPIRGGAYMRQAARRIGSKIACAAWLLIATAPSLAEDRVVECHGDRRVCQILVAGEEDLASMLVSGDVGIVSRLFADDAVWTLASGERWTKAAAIAALRSAPRMTRSRLLQASVHQHGAVAIVLWNESWHNPATNREERSFGTDTWIRRKRGWQIIASQEARLPAASTR